MKKKKKKYQLSKVVMEVNLKIITLKNYDINYNFLIRRTPQHNV